MEIVIAIIGAITSAMVSLALTSIFNSIFRGNRTLSQIRSHREEYDDAPSNSYEKAAIQSEYKARVKSYWVRRQQPYREARGALAFMIVYTFIWYLVTVGAVIEIANGINWPLLIVTIGLLVVLVASLGARAALFTATKVELNRRYPNADEPFSLPASKLIRATNNKFLRFVLGPQVKERERIVEKAVDFPAPPQIVTE